VLWQDTNVTELHSTSIFTLKTRRHNPEDLNLKHYRRENLKTRIWTHAADTLRFIFVEANCYFMTFIISE
jgi:hypothetical protein